MHETVQRNRVTQTPLHHQAPAGLQAWLDGPEAAAVKSVKEVVIDGERCVIKRREAGLGRGLSYVLRYLRALLLAVGCKLALGEFPRPSVLLRNGLAYEAERLRHLLLAGCRVPAVWWQQPGLVVLEHVGDDLPFFLRRAEYDERLGLVRMLAADLAAFHMRGFWHGGAQVRNVTLREDGQLWRIDFEENIGAALSLPMAQAYDLFQTLSSVVSLSKIPREQVPIIGKLILETYFEANPDPAVRAALKRLARVVCGLAGILKPLAGKLPWRDVRTFFQVSDTLRSVLQ
ncbi:hypothetical protein L499_A0430 [Bordetella holmesii CDC-H635-BH]|nr:hypothetical protein L573_0814 [Bordetella holmesii H620]KAK80637.1 hypothetical protein L503_0421 [Bordetella holmesii CDC-H809-BH]KAK84540.1 hypothetical protein L496_0415 [Bordetella holmesii CDC-H572-BH]KAK99714.1 hypothetical protein L499_A0430 [Bordetella holmesii CDC-H635-BH]KCV01169.1 hypothetical protein L501_0417 [Bordetella holmesii CDC-H719-BH]KCV09978.1 hypothetical protein AZ25_0849 [Bordetella holmesii 04P3421]